MLSFSWDTSAVEQTLTSMSDQLAQFPDKMEEELTAWQKEDMRRKYPNTERPAPNSVQTQVWPTSRAYLTGGKQRMRKKLFARRRGRPRGSLSGTGRRPSPGRKQAASRRPVLRQSLVESLEERMRKLALSLLRWKV